MPFKTLSLVFIRQVDKLNYSLYICKTNKILTKDTTGIIAADLRQKITFVMKIMVTYGVKNLPQKCDSSYS